MLKPASLTIFAALALLAATDIDTMLKVIDREIGKVKNPNPVTARELGTDFQRNSIRAEREYKDQIVMVKGPVRNISRNPVTLLAFVSLSTATPEAWQAGNDYTAPMSINCYFSKDREREAEHLYKGQPEAKLVGKVIGATQFEVMLIGCRLY